MGPTTLFDKSFLQSLSLDESVWFDQFFYPVISPLFYVETLADLEKAVRSGRTPEQEVGVIADKTPELGGGPCVYHRDLCLADLMGNVVPMTGRIPVAGGRPVKSDGKQGVVYDPSPEAMALSRWRNREFLAVEREFARKWRTSLNELDLNAVAAAHRAMGIDETCKSLEDARCQANAIINTQGKPIDRMKLAFLFLGIPKHLERPILARWQALGCPPLSVFAPYAAHVLAVEVFFQIASNSGFISPERPSNRIDISYLAYLPFCMVFVSSDNLHRRSAPHFLRPDQDFIWGEDLKTDLKRLNDHYLQLPESEREAGLFRFASHPPETGDYLVSQMWDRHLRAWRYGSQHPTELDNHGEVVEQVNKTSNAPTLRPEELDFDPNKADFMTIKRQVRRRKGSWWQLPKDLGTP